MSREAALVLKGHTKWIRSIAELGSQDAIVTASQDHTVRLWFLSEARCVRTYSDYGDEVNDIAVVNETIVVTVSDRTVQVLQITDGSVMAVSKSFPHFLVSCAGLNLAIAVVGDCVGNLFKIEWHSGEIEIVERKNSAHKWHINQIFAYGALFATCSDDKTVKLWDASSLALIHAFNGHADCVNCVAYDDAYLLTGSENIIRIYDVSSADYVTTITAHRTVVKFLHIIEGVNVVVSGGSDGVILLHEFPSGDCIGKYDVGMRISSGTLLESGRLAVAGYTPFGIKIFDFEQLRNLVPSRRNASVTRHSGNMSSRNLSMRTKSSVLENAFTSVLANTKILTVPFILDTICAENVLSAGDLYCGHNIVLLAIRCGVITAAEVRKLDGYLWFFEENLYYPASKLIHESGHILYPVFHHAQHVGIIRDGHRFRCEHENRADTEERFDSMQNSIDTLHARLSNIDERFDSVSDAVNANARNFQFLFEALKKKEKYMKYAGFAKVLLSLIPLFGKACGDAAYASADMLLSLSTEDFVETGIDIAKAGVGEIANVDLSNAQLTYCILSKQRMSLMSEETQSIITTAVSESGFECMSNLRACLEEQIQNGALEERHVAMLDLGSSEWLDNNTSFGKAVENEQDHESSARLQFQSFALGRGKKNLEIPEATAALNVVMMILHVSKELSVAEFETKFVRVSKELEVSEDSFVKVFRVVMANIRTLDEDYWARIYMDVFHGSNGGRTSIGIEFATRTLKHACKELGEQGIYGETPKTDINITSKKMARFDRDGDGKMDGDEFVNAALSILHQFVRGETATYLTVLADRLKGLQMQAQKKVSATKNYCVQVLEYPGNS